jgi:hypothetical protein
MQRIAQIKISITEYLETDYCYLPRHEHDHSNKRQPTNLAVTCGKLGSHLSTSVTERPTQRTHAANKQTIRSIGRV